MNFKSDICIAFNFDVEDSTKAIMLRDDIHEQLKDNVDYNEGRITLGDIVVDDRILVQLSIKTTVDASALPDSIKVNLGLLK